MRRGVLGRELRAARAERARARVPHAAARLAPDFLAWAQAIPTPRGLPLDFERFPFQPELYRAFADPTVKDLVLMKGTQLGISELLLRLGIYFADTHAGTTFYVFAAAHQLADFTDSRVDALLEHSPYLRRRSGRVWNKGLKQFGLGRCFFRGSQAKTDLLAIDADVLLLDEYDSLNPLNIPEAEQRIGASTLALIRRVGVPSDPESGIAKLYRESDQRQWHVDCDACGETQVLTFHEHVDWDEDEHGVITNVRVLCRACREQLDVGRGRWIAAYPGRPRRGYQVHRLMVRGADLRQLDRGEQAANALPRPELPQQRARPAPQRCTGRPRPDRDHGRRFGGRELHGRADDDGSGVSRH